jgi:hypothetical protein
MPDAMLIKMNHKVLTSRTALMFVAAFSKDQIGVFQKEFLHNIINFSNRDNLQRCKLEVLTVIARLKKQDGEVFKKSARAGEITEGSCGGAGVDGSLILELENGITTLRRELEGL